MFFTKFTLSNFKCFRKEQTLLFAQPKSGSEGSGITYIVGANNSGKTTIIESLSIKDKTKIKTSERIDEGNPEFILYQNKDIKRKCELIRNESYTIKEDPLLLDSEKFEIISSRRHWESNANSTYSNVGDSFQSSFQLENRQNRIDVASELKTIEANSIKYNEFIDLVKQVIPEFTKFAVAYEDHEFIMYISGLGVKHKTDLLGDGVITVIRILLQLYVDKVNPLIIDEPELSLHPSAQKRLLKVIAEYSMKRQIVISTHSPLFINWKYLQNGAVLNRVVKIDDKETKIYSIDKFINHQTLISAANWQQPFLLDEVAKEIFFTEDRILFLEGQEDVGLLRRDENFSNINIFGYGVRGKDNFEFVFKIASELGFSKVSCILDCGESESTIKGNLEKKFPNYKVFQWNRNDIRDKKSCNTKAKIGYFRENGEKKGSEDLDDFEEKIIKIKEYLNP